MVYTSPIIEKNNILPCPLTKPHRFYQMENFILIFICLVLGVLLQQCKVFTENSYQTLNLYVIWVALPALILSQVPKLTFSTDLFVLLWVPWIVAILGIFLALAACKFFSWSSEVKAVLLLTLPLGNTSFLGLPMIEAFFGTEMVSYGIIYDQFGSFLLLSTYGSLILALYSTQKQSIAGVTKRVFTFPPFLALLLALIFARQLQQPDLAGCFRMIGASLVPVVMLAIGMQLKMKLAPGQTLAFFYTMGVKLLVIPFIILLVCHLMGLTSNASRIAVFEAGMPPMVTAGAMAMSAGLAPRLAAALVGWGILFSFASLSFLSIFL